MTDELVDRVVAAVLADFIRDGRKMIEAACRHDPREAREADSRPGVPSKKLIDALEAKS